MHMFRTKFCLILQGLNVHFPLNFDLQFSFYLKAIPKFQLNNRKYVPHFMLLC